MKDENVTSLIAAIVDFLETGEYKGSDYSPSAFVTAFPFLESIIAKSGFDNGQKHAGFSLNANWFWCEKNNSRREELIRDVKRVETFDINNHDYLRVVTRYEKGDAYGIMKPIVRGFKPVVIPEYHKKCLDHYNIGYSNVYFATEEQYGKLMYCEKNDISVFQFETWVWAEMIVALPLSFYESQLVDELVFGSLKELEKIYKEPEYDALVEKMRDTVQLHRTNRKVEANALLKEMQNTLSDPLAVVDRDGYKDKIRAWFSPPDGADAEERLALAEIAETYLEEIDAMLPF